MKTNRPRIPIKLLIVIIVCLILGVVALQLIPKYVAPEKLGKNVLLNAIPFILIFASILLTYIMIISIVAQMLSNQISPRSFKIVESILIAGIVLGVLGMFQPWFFIAYPVGFLVLLFSTLGFILWSHVSPKPKQRQEEIAVTSLPSQEL